jgi:phage portal protein BeeE
MLQTPSISRRSWLAGLAALAPVGLARTATPPSSGQERRECYAETIRAGIMTANEVRSREQLSVSAVCAEFNVLPSEAIEAGLLDTHA